MNKEKYNFKKISLSFFVSLIVLSALIAPFVSIYFYQKYKAAQNLLSDLQGPKLVLPPSFLKRILTPTPASSLFTASIPPSAIRPSEEIRGNLLIALYNGTTTASILDNFERNLKSAFKSITVIEKANAQKRDYPISMMTDLGRQNSPRALDIAKKLNLEIVPLPEFEISPPKADYLIIVGRDRL